MVLADHDLDVHAEVIGIAEDFEDAAASLAVEGGPFGDFDIDDETFRSRREVVRGVGVVGVVAEHAVRGGF